MGHFANRDHLRSLGRELLLQVAIASFIGDAGWIQSVASGITARSKAQYSQSQEYQADEFGLALLQQTYGHVAGATDFFARLSQQKSVNLAFKATHPGAGSRVAQLQRLQRRRNYRIGELEPLPKTLANSVSDRG